MYKVMIVDDETITQNLISRYLNEKMPECRITGICRNGSPGELPSGPCGYSPGGYPDAHYEWSGTD